MTLIAPKLNVAELKHKLTVKEEVEGHLKHNPEYAYHTARIMVDFYGIKEEEMEGSFKDWKNKSAISLYRNIRNALIELEGEGKAIKRKDGKANYYYWKEEKSRSD
jgi:hypothetical protein